MTEQITTARKSDQAMRKILEKFQWVRGWTHLKGLDDRPRLPRNQRIPHLKRGGFKGR